MLVGAALASLPVVVCIGIELEMRGWYADVLA